VKLSPSQLNAMGKLHKVAFFSAYELKISRNTLEALVKKGLAESKHEAGAFSFPRTGILYRLSSNVDELDYLQTNY